MQDKAEYTIQIYYDHGHLQSKVLFGNSELQDLQRQMHTASKGKAYLLSKKLDQSLKELVSSEEVRLANKYLPRIHRQVDKLIIDGKRSWIPEDCRDLKLLGSYSCLVRQENVEQLGEILDAINSQDGFRIRFTGPWAPFSFVKLGDLS
ncbi:Gas vesicle synthesis protein GvpL/GvpF [uncultured archaeon]|nr:Gas vesicle synthesis protein GvpL/GvpF [uncultured archaeon]